MDADSPDNLSIGELADAAGLTRRAIRFYVQQKLLPAPLGLGRGRHYDRRHLSRLIRVIALQQQGHSLEAIRQVLALAPVADDNGDLRHDSELDQQHDENEQGTDDALRLGRLTEQAAGSSPVSAPISPSPSVPQPAVLSAELWTRLKITEGVELSFDTTRFNPTVEQLLTLRQFIRETLL